MRLVCDVAAVVVNDSMQSSVPLIARTHGAAIISNFLPVLAEQITD